jgi:Taurine catabolism dioxygenase TauD, TfdA family
MRLEETLELVARTIGTPVPSRGRRLVQELRPTSSQSAHTRSLSKIFGEGEFPLHVDTAHWPVPCRYIVMACAAAGRYAARTKLLPIERLSLTDEERELLFTTVFRVRGGRRSFFGTVASLDRAFFRFDPGCMEPTCRNGSRIMNLMSSSRWADSVEAVAWESGAIAVIDNWRVLHGRDAASDEESGSRALLRVLVQ